MSTRYETPNTNYETPNLLKRILKIVGLACLFIAAAGVSAYLTLTLIIKSEDTVVVPDLVGKDVVYALEFLTELELNTKVKGSEYSENIPKNNVTFQDPTPGTEIKKGRDVRIIISKGPRRIAMPNLMSLSIHQARLILEENGVCRGELSRTFSQSMDKDHVIAQVPPAGSMINRGTCANLLISIGSRPGAYKMPDLDGLALDEAMLSIEKANLIIGEIKSAFIKNRPKNVVVNQDPLPGYRVIAGNPVHLVINRKASKKGRPGRYSQKGGSLFRYRLDNGFLRRRIRVKLNSAGITNDLFDEFVKPGEEIWLLIPRDEAATVFLFENDSLVKTETYDGW
jgi:serine/threonine-protein kinase